MNKLELIIKALSEKQAQDIVAMDMEQVSPMFDTFVICSVSNIRLMQAIIDHVEEKLEEHGIFAKNIEGKKDSHWILLDYGDIVIHVFEEEERNKYLLEKLWSDVPHIDIASYL